MSKLEPAVGNPIQVLEEKMTILFKRGLDCQNIFTYHGSTVYFCMGGCQKCGPFLGTLNIRCRIHRDPKAVHNFDNHTYKKDKFLKCGTNPAMTSVRYWLTTRNQGRLSFPRGSKYPIISYLRFWVIVIIVQVLGKYMNIRYLDP